MKQKIGSVLGQQAKKDLFPLLKLAIPLALTGMMQSSVYFFETLFLAHVGSDALAAGALVSWFFGTLIVILFGTLSSINILIAHKFGENDQHGISLVLRDGLLLAVLLVIPGFLLLWNMSSLFLFFGQSPSIAILAQSYLHALAWGVLPNFVMIAILEFIIGLGHSKTIMLYSMLSVSLTIFFSFVFIFGKLGMPALGVAGAGWGVTVSHSLTVFVLVISVLMNKTYRPYFRHIFKFQRPDFLVELLKVGVPIGAMYCVEVAFFLVLTLLMGSLGKDLLAGNQIVMQYSGFLMGITFSIAQAITVRMGHLLGEKNTHSAERAAYMGMLTIGIFMGICSIFYWFYPEVLISIDLNVYSSKNKEIIRYAEQFFAIAAPFMIFEALRVSLFGALRGLKDTRFTLLTSIICFWGIALPIGYLLATYFQLEGKGLWWGMVISAVCSALLLFFRFNFKIKIYKKTLI